MAALFRMLGLSWSSPATPCPDMLDCTLYGKKTSDGVNSVHFALPRGARDGIVALYQLLDVMQQLGVEVPPLNSDKEVVVSVPAREADALVAAGKASGWTCTDCRL